MDPAVLPRDPLTEARSRLERARAALESAREHVRQSTPRTDLLADRPDLLPVAGLSDDHPRRQAELARVVDEYQRAYDKTRRDRESLDPFTIPPELGKQIELYHFLHIEMKNSASEAQLIPMLEDSRLDELNKDNIKDRIEFLRSNCVPLELLHFNNCFGGRVAGCDQARWDRYIEFVRERYRCLKQESEGLREEYKRQLEEYVQAALSETRSRVDDARRAVAESSDACKHLLEEAGDLLEERMGLLLAERTRSQQAEFDSALSACKDARDQCISQFRTQLDQNNSTVQFEDFIPDGDHILRGELEY